MPGGVSGGWGIGGVVEWVVVVAVVAATVVVVVVVVVVGVDRVRVRGRVS